MRIKVYILHKHTNGTWSISTHRLHRRDGILVWGFRRHCTYSKLNQIIKDYGDSPIPVLRLVEDSKLPFFATQLVNPEELAGAKLLREFLRDNGYEH